MQFQNPVRIHIICQINMRMIPIILLIMKVQDQRYGNKPVARSLISLLDAVQEVTITGTGTYLKEKDANIKVIAIQAQKNHLLQGLRNFEESAKPDLFLRREKVVDEWYTATNEKSFEMVKTLVEKENILIGPSSGSVMASMYDYIKNHNEGIFVGIFADDGRKFQSLYRQQNLFSDEEYKKHLINCRLLPPLIYQ